MSPMSRYLIIGGILILLTGILLHFFPGLFNWFGNLPGDIRRERGNTGFYFPVTSLLLISVALSILVNLIRIIRKLL
jgi:hypothetical protein